MIFEIEEYIPTNYSGDIILLAIYNTGM